MKEEHLTWLSLMRSPHIGAKQFWFYYEKLHVSSQKTQNWRPTVQKEMLLENKSLKDPHSLSAVTPSTSVLEEYQDAQKKGVHFLLSQNADYPQRLKKTLNDFPPVLSFLGRKECLNMPTLAIVGARNAGTAGRKMAYNLAFDLSKAGFTIVSGMARGIDAAAHWGALAAGGSSLAVLAGGVDVVYPLENQKLYTQLLEKGGVLSEMPLGHQPMANLFPQRNRIISGLSFCVIVVEASLRSGSLITARYALEQGLDIFAVPGHPFSPQSHGVNRLLKQGAFLVESAQDILENIYVKTPHSPEKNILKTCAEVTLEEKKMVLALLSEKFIPIEKIFTKTSFSIKKQMSILAELELEGLVVCEGGKIRCKS